MPELSTHSRVKISDNVLFQELQGEAVLLDLTTGVYFGLDRVGARIWQLLGEQDSLGGVVQRVLQDYDVTEEHCTQDVIALVTRLQDDGLVTVQ